jgi:RinA family phage transcriptional activator
MRINKSVFRYIEFELYNYQETKRELERYKEEILESTNIPEVNVQTMPGNVTESKAIKITSSPFVMRAEKTIKAIDKALAILGEQHWRIFKLKYCDCMPWQEVCLEMDISDRTYFRWRRELVMTVGQQLGLLNIE